MAGGDGQFFSTKTSVGCIFGCQFSLGVDMFFFCCWGDVTWLSLTWLEAKAGDWRQIYPEQLVDPQNAQDWPRAFLGGTRWGWWEGRFYEVTHGNFGRWGWYSPIEYGLKIFQNPLKKKHTPRFTAEEQEWFDSWDVVVPGSLDQWPCQPEGWLELYIIQFIHVWMYSRRSSIAPSFWKVTQASCYICLFCFSPFIQPPPICSPYYSTIVPSISIGSTQKKHSH